jgi:hypothetical protein
MSKTNQQSPFYPIEEAILHRYFNIPLPEQLRGISLLGNDATSPKDAVHLETDIDGYDDESKAIDNAVARLILSSIQDRLPNWAVSYGEGHIEKTRESRTYAKNSLSLLPLHLFTINWADSGPGFSWPEKYFVTWVPVFDRYVVTASRDTAEGYGYADEAIGWFDVTKDRVEESKNVISLYWERLVTERWQERWEHLFNEGAISSAEADDLADGVWGGDDEDEEEYEGEEDVADSTVSISPEPEKKLAVSVSSVITNPIVLDVSKHLSCYINQDKLIATFCGLGSVDIMIGYSYVTGMGQMFHQGAVKEGVPRYCREYYDTNGHFPSGVHDVVVKVTGTSYTKKFKFPDTPVILPGGLPRHWVTGPAGYLDRDWYIHGTTVHRISPDDPVDVILRAPIRFQYDAFAIRFAIEFCLNAGHVPKTELASLHGLFDGLGSKIEEAAAKVRAVDKYPPNLAELWRRQDELGITLNPLVETYIRYSQSSTAPALICKENT